MKSKRKIVSFLIGAAIFLGVAGAAYAWIGDRVNDETKKLAPVVLEIIEAKDNPTEIAKMTDSQRYSRFALTWIIHTDFGVQAGDAEAVEKAIMGGASHTNNFELYTFIMATDAHVVGLRSEQKEAYSQVGALDSFIKLDLTETFSSAWNQCRDQLAEQYESNFAQWALVFELAFPDDETACPSLQRKAAKIASR